MKTGIFFLALAIVGACVERGPREPSDDLDGGNRYDACKLPCANLRRLHCPEGERSISGYSCETNCTNATALRPLPLKCWAQAETVVAAKSCGSLRCVP